MAKRVPSRIEQKANALLTDYINGKIHARKLVGDHGLTLDVTYRYRLFCRNAENHLKREFWLILSHEDYNKRAAGNWR